MNKKWLIIGTISFSVGLSLSLVINRDIKQAALTGLLSVPATTAAILVTEYQRKQKLNDRISTQQKQLQGLIQQEAELKHSMPVLFAQVENLKQQSENIKAAISSPNTDKHKLQSELDILRNQIHQFGDRKLNLEQEITNLKIRLQQLREQETVAKKILEDLSNSQVQIKINIESDRYTHQQLQEHIHDLEEQLNNLEKQNGQLQGLIQQEAKLNNSISLLSDRVKNLKQQSEDIKAAISSSNTDKHKLQSELDILRNQIHQFGDRKLNLEQEITNLKIRLQQFREQETVAKKTLEDLSNFQAQNKINIKSDRYTHQQLQKQKGDLEEHLNNLEKQIQTLTKELDQLQKLIETEDTSSPRKLKPASVPDWKNSFEDANIKQVFLHLDQHNSLTEAELIQILGSSRQARRFDGHLEQYLTQVPFSVIVKTTSNGKRYIKSN
jgi:chromosome segregation ATPase